jgi:hypothetical protein
MPGMSNPLHPDQMSAEERIAELAAILADGFMRLNQAKSTPILPLFGESSLDFDADQSGAAETKRGDRS